MELHEIDDDDLMLSQICENYENEFQEFLFELPMDDDIMLSQMCETAEENLDDETLTGYLDHINEVCMTANDLGITETELEESLASTIDCRDMANTGGCQIVSSWSHRKTQIGKKNI